MAYAEPGQVVSRRAESNFTEKFVVCAPGTADDQVKLPASAGATPLGVIQDTATAGQAVAVMISGVTKVVANAAITKDDPLKLVTTTGRVATGTPGTDKIIGHALQAATAAGQIISMLIRPELS
jgi:hypothetical protein